MRHVSVPMPRGLVLVALIVAAAFTTVTLLWDVKVSAVFSYNPQYAQFNTTHYQLTYSGGTTFMALSGKLYVVSASVSMNAINGVGSNCGTDTTLCGNPYLVPTVVNWNAFPAGQKVPLQGPRGTYYLYRRGDSLYVIGTYRTGLGALYTVALAYKVGASMGQITFFRPKTKAEAVADGDVGAICSVLGSTAGWIQYASDYVTCTDGSWTSGLVSGLNTAPVQLTAGSVIGDYMTFTGNTYTVFMGQAFYPTAAGTGLFKPAG